VSRSRQARQRAKLSRAIERETKRGRNDATRGGQGGEPPSYLDTLGKGSRTSCNDSAFRDAGLDRPTGGRTRAAPRQPRHALATTQRHSWRSYRSRVADALHTLGMPATAADVRACGELVSMWDCGDCGRAAVRATAAVSCKSRGCPHCSRVLAAERVERLTAAALTVPSSWRAQRPRVLKELQAASDRAAKTLDYWTLRSKDAAKVSRARDAYRDARWTLERARDTRWQWRLITVAPRWDVADAGELTVEALRARVDELWAQWAAIWRRLSVGGLGAAIVSIEISRGFVHLHALVWSPWISPTHLADLAAIAGARDTHVHVRLAAQPNDPRTRGLSVVDRVKHAVKEAVKYTCKAPSPRLDWVSGDRRPVAHPELVARWVVAMRSKQLGRVYGLARRPDQEAPAESKGEKCDGKVCPVCKGHSIVARVLPAQKAAREILRARARAAALQIDARFIPRAIDWCPVV
jgi:hypothetical protein